MKTQINPHSKTHYILQFKRTWTANLNLTEEQSAQLLEDLRAVIVLTEASFRKSQKKGAFTDKTGDMAIAHALSTLNYQPPSKE